MVNFQQEGGGSSLIFIKYWSEDCCGYYQEREERLRCETKFKGSRTLTTTFVTLSSNNYKSLLFLQISFNILSWHILLISVYSISTLSSLPSIIPAIPSSLSRYLLSVQRYACRWATSRHRVNTTTSHWGKSGIHNIICKRVACAITANMLRPDAQE